MRDYQRKLEKRPPIRVGIVGAGLMGGSLFAQLCHLKGFIPSVIANRSFKRLEKVTKGHEVTFTNDVEEAKTIVASGGTVATTNNDLAYLSGTEVLVDATGNTLAGAELSLGALNHGVHVVSLNVEADVLIGHVLRDLARKKGLVYTGIYGDEPGSIVELYDFLDLIGFEIIALGKGKNNPLRVDATPEDLAEEAISRGLSPRMLCSFVDGTNTMIELNAVCNATGFLPDVPGCHGLFSDARNLANLCVPKEMGGVLEHVGVVEYVHGVAPGVFAVVKAKEEVSDYAMRFLKMGEGPAYTIYRPYHLTSLEVPISIAKAVLDGESSIEPVGTRPVARTVAMAKRNLDEGKDLEGIGGCDVYGVLMDEHEAQDLLPIGLITEGTRLRRHVKKAEALRFEDVILPENILTKTYQEFVSLLTRGASKTRM